MKVLLWPFCLLLFCSNTVFAQQLHFIFFQTENRQPFYVIMNGKNYSSTTVGYVVIPKLENGTYEFRIGFPKKDDLPQQYEIVVSDNDQGFMIKNFGEASWGIANLQSEEIQYAGQKKNKVKEEEEVVKKPEIISSVDSIRDEQIGFVKQDSIKLISTEKIDTNLLSQKDVIWLSVNKNDSGLVYKYNVNNQGQWDTVDVFIKYGIVAHNDPKINEDTTITSEHIEKITNTDTGHTNFLNMEFASDTATVKKDIVNDTATHEVKLPYDIETPVFNSNCIAQADDKDFFSLRKKMVLAENSDEMVLAAKKLMRKKCFTTDQIRNLSALFLTDAERYQFLDAAYPFASDAYQYNKLIDLLKDDYYIQRFKAMIRK